MASIKYDVIANGQIVSTLKAPIPDQLIARCDTVEDLDKAVQLHVEKHFEEYTCPGVHKKSRQAIRKIWGSLRHDQGKPKGKTKLATTVGVLLAIAAFVGLI